MNEVVVILYLRGIVGISTINTVISGRKKHSGANVQWLEEGVAVKPGWRGEVQSYTPY